MSVLLPSRSGRGRRQHSDSVLRPILADQRESIGNCRRQGERVRLAEGAKRALARGAQELGRFSDATLRLQAGADRRHELDGR